MNARHVSIRTCVAMLALTLGALWAPQRAEAQTPGPYSGSANADLVHLKAMNIPDSVQVAEAAVAPSEAEMSSAGIEGGGKSAGRATNLDVDLFSGEIAGSALVEAKHRAPSDEQGPVKETMVDVPADPLLNAKVATASAHGRWNNAGCVPVGTPIATALSELADANVITGTELGDALLAIDNEEGGTVFSKSTTDLVNVAGQTGKGVRSTALTQLTAITLFKGTENQLTVNVLAPPVVEAIATGKPGTAKVTYSEPVLQVVDSTGEVLGELNAAEGNLEIDLSPLAILRLGHLESKIADDGTQATGRASLLEVIVLDEPEAVEPLARVTIAGGEATAKAPSGGVECAGGAGPTDVSAGGDENNDCATDNPLSGLTIDSSSSSVTAGSTFTYTITVRNGGECTLTNVRVEDTVGGPPGSKITATDRQADSVEGLTVVWNDIGPLEPGAQKVLRVTVAVPSGAGEGDSFSSDVTVSASAGEQQVDQTASEQGPTVGAAQEVAVGDESLPRSGAGIATLVAIAFSLIAGGQLLRRRSKARIADLDE